MGVIRRIANGVSVVSKTAANQVSAWFSNANTKNIPQSVYDLGVDTYNESVYDINKSIVNDYKTSLNKKVDEANEAYTEKVLNSTTQITDLTLEKFSDVIENKKLLTSDLKGLISFRSKLYENLINVLLENYYINKIYTSAASVSKYKDFLTSETNKSAKTKDTKSILYNLEQAATIFESNSKDTILNYDESLKSLGIYFNNQFLKYGNLFYDSDISFFDNTDNYGIFLDKSPKYKATVTEVSKYPFNVNFSLKNADNLDYSNIKNPFSLDHTIKLELLDEFILEDGENFPYIIRNSDDFTEKNKISGKKVLISSFEIDVDSDLTISNCNGYGHKLTINIKPGCSKINIKSSKDIYLHLVYASDEIYDLVTVNIDKTTSYNSLFDITTLNENLSSNITLGTSGYYYVSEGEDVEKSPTILICVKDEQVNVLNYGIADANKKQYKLAVSNVSSETEYDYSSRRITDDLTFEFKADTTESTFTEGIKLTRDSVKKSEVRYTLSINKKINDSDFNGSYSFSVNITTENSFNDNNTDIDSLLYSIGELSLLKNGLSSLNNHKSDYYTHYKSLLRNMIDSWDDFSANTSESVKSFKNDVLNYAQSLVYILSVRESSDSLYDNSYTSDIYNNILSIADYAASYDKYSENIEKCINSIQTEIPNTIEDICESILTLNTYIESYYPIFGSSDFDNGYSDLKIITDNFDSSLKQEITNTEWEFKPLPETIRYFSEWNIKIKKNYLPGDIHNLFLLYATQELGMNLNNTSLDDTTDISVVLKQLSNRALLSLLYKRDYTAKAISNDSLLITRLDGDAILSRKNIFVEENAVYSVLPYELKEMVPGLELFERVDFYKLISGEIDSIYLTGTEINQEEYRETINKVINLTDFAFLSAVFKTSKKSEILERIEKIYNYLFSDSIDIDFKILILRVLFLNLLDKLKTNISKNTKTTIIDNDDLCKISILNKETVTKNNIATYNFYLAKDISEYLSDLNYYINSWTVYYNGVSSLLQYYNDDFLKYILNSDKNETAREYIKNKEGTTTKIKNSISRVWRIFKNTLEL